MLDLPVKGRGGRRALSKRIEEGKGLRWLDPDAQAGIRTVVYLSPPERAHGSLDRHATYIVAAHNAGAAR